MAVDSFFSMYTTYYGWMIHNVLWEALWYSGVLIIPFIGILVSSFVESATSQEARDASTTSLRRFEINSVIALIVIILGGIPTVTLKAQKIQHIDHCARVSYYDKFQKKTVNYGQTGTGLDKPFKTQMKGFNGYVKVPVFFYGVISFTGSLNAMVRVKMRCGSSKADIVTIQNHVISDGALADELGRFRSDCYLKAKQRIDTGFSAYRHRNPPPVIQTNSTKNPNAPPTVTDKVWLDNLRRKYQSSPFGNSIDLSYMGNVVFLNSEFLYKDKTMRSYDAIPGWAGPGRKGGRYSPASQATKGGRYDPNCYEWWTDKQNGLFNRISGYAEKQSALVYAGANLESTGDYNKGHIGWDRVVSEAKNWGRKISRQVTKQYIVKQLSISTSFSAPRSGQGWTNTQVGSTTSGFRGNPYMVSATSDYGSGGLYGETNTSGLRGIGYFPSHSRTLTGDYGKWLEGKVMMTKSLIYREMWPIITALMLLGIYCLIPISLVISKYSVGILMGVGLIIFSVIFMDAIHHFGLWVDEMYFQTFFAAGNYQEFGLNELSKNKHLAINIGTKMLVMGLPTLFALMMAIGGYKFVSGINNFMASSVNSYASGAGAKAAGMTNGLVMSGISAATRGVGGLFRMGKNLLGAGSKSASRALRAFKTGIGNKLK